MTTKNETKAQFTPGPWETWEEDESWGIFGHRTEGRIGAQYLMADVWSDGERAEANAHLIAAAPSLYAALARVAEIIEAGDDISNPAFYGTEHVQILSALAKAQGKP